MFHTAGLARSPLGLSMVRQETRGPTKAMVVVQRYLRHSFHLHGPLCDIEAPHGTAIAMGSCRYSEASMAIRRQRLAECMPGVLRLC
ncbi:hypothetical protein CERSUDRAFT_87349 [Gelatoporia subvermispora B]|uniref:Uncharacterized protein n=1 Tax=Ceriporiopsis subvermispora (strain B) TaxID=914234 RepID=M2PCS1_CERS8|nr:hypothetical protein CERSUDRAFT_87349 [Gelatoporia subvermispora B]